MRNDVFEDTAVLCQRVNKQVGEVFSSPETVMAKLIQNIFENKLQVFLLFLICLVLFRHAFICSYLTPLCLQAHVREKLDGTRHSDVEQYLKNLYDLYTRYWFSCSHICFHSLPVYTVTLMLTFYTLSFTLVPEPQHWPLS